jgi:hypothetical protein
LSVKLNAWIHRHRIALRWARFWIMMSSLVVVAGACVLELLGVSL